MSTALTVSAAAAKVVWNFQNNLAFGSPAFASQYSYSASLANGTAANQADLIYIAQGSLAASASLSLDLAGALTDIFGNTITMARVKVIYVTQTGASTLYVGGASSAGVINWISSAGTFATDQPKVSVRDGGCFFLSATDVTSYAVTATTADILKFTNADGANAAAYNIVIVGASA